MSNERDELAKLIYDEGAYCGSCEYESYVTCNVCREVCRGYATAILAAGYRKPRIIHTAEELDQLTEGSLIVDSEPDVLAKAATGKWVSPKYVDDSFNSRELDFPITVVSEATK